MASLGNRTNQVWMKLDTAVASTIYMNESGKYQAMIWNPTNTAHTVYFYTEDGLLATYTIQSYSFESVTLN